MPRGQHPNSLENLKKGHRFGSADGSARENAKRASAERRDIAAEMRALLDAEDGKGNTRRKALAAKLVLNMEKSPEWYKLGLRMIGELPPEQMDLTHKGGDVEKIKSITPQSGPLTDIWIEEATETAYEDYKQLDKRLRGASKHVKRLTLSFNPVYKTHWIYREFFGIWDDAKQYAESDTVSILKTTYKDNRFLTADDRAALENEKDPYFREVYTLGNWGVLGDIIFRNWRTEDLAPLSAAYPQRLFGLDFGFSSDPCAAVNVAVDKRKKRVLIFDELYERGLTNSMLAERLKTFAGRNFIFCDSAEPKSIRELRNYDLNARAARKGPDSVIHGIQWLQGFELVLDTRCQNLRNELTLYQWRRDKDGNSMAIPEDKNNHLIDALRYAVELESTAFERRSLLGE